MWSQEYFVPFHRSSHPSSISRSYVNLNSFLKTCHLIIPSHPLQDVREFRQLFEDFLSDYPIPESTRTWSNVRLPLIWSFHPLRRSTNGTWTWSIVWKLLIWPSHPVPFIYPQSVLFFIRLQSLHELSQLFEYLSSDHPIPSRSNNWPSLRTRLGQLFERSLNWSS